MEKQLEAPLRRVVEFLEQNDFRYAIIGGIALAQWGVIRATHDVDIKIFAPVRAAIKSAFPDPARNQMPANPLIVAVTIDEVIVDFLLALPGYEELIVERAVRRELDGWSAWICSAEDLIIQKATAGRVKDWQDVESLLIEQRGHLDEAYIEGWLSQFAEALEEPELVSKYTVILTRVKSLPGGLGE
jgi:predicted nucleotidyltransferase